MTRVRAEKSQIETLEKKVDKLESYMTKNFQELFLNVKEIKDLLVGSEYQNGIIHEYREMRNWYTVADKNGELKFLSKTTAVSKGLYILGVLIGASSIWNIAEIVFSIIEKIK